MRGCLDRLHEEGQRVSQARGARDQVAEELTRAERAAEGHEKAAEVALKTHKLLEELTDRKREQVRSKIEALVTHGIQAVFGGSYSFHIEQKVARSQVTFEYRIRHDFEGVVHESDLRGFHGGGLVALVGFLLRVVMVLYSVPSRRRIIFLDETMAALDGDKRQAFAQLMKQLGDSLSIQFVLITHSPEYTEEADVAYELTQTSGITKFSRIV